MVVANRKRRSQVAAKNRLRLARVDQLESRVLLSTLVWSDEFNGAVGSQPSAANWSYDLGGGGWGNAELETYTNSTNNIKVVADPNATDGSALEITAIKTGATSYTSARIKTQNLQSFTYGHIEARLKLPAGQGVWPAFWMLGDNIGSAGWPTAGEIDIMENIGKYPARVYGTIHGPGYSGANGIGANYTNPTGNLSDAYHTYAVDWSPNSVSWLIDGHVYETRTPADLPAGKQWVFDHNFFIILNLAIGGQFPGNPDGTSTFPQNYMIDYVRVYQDDAPPPPPPPPPPVYSAFKVNFQDTTSAGFTGYLSDTGAAYGLNATNGYTYGWNIDNTVNERNRNAGNSPDERYDTLAQMQRAGGATEWDISVPNGKYQVHIVGGDPSYFDSTYAVDVEGVLALSGTTSAANPWLDNTVTVAVTDGKLTISNGAGSVNDKINFIDVTAVTTDTPPTVTNKTPANGATVTAATTNVDVTFSEAVTGVDASDLVLTGAGAAGASVGAPTNQGGNVWRFPVGGLVNGAVNVSLAPDAHDIEDGAGNDLAHVTWAFTVNIPDLTPPTVTNKVPASGATIITGAVNVDVTFSEAVTGVDATDLVLTGAGAAGANIGVPTNQGGNVWRFPVSGLVNGAVNVSLAPDANDIEDVAGNDLAHVTWAYTVAIPAASFSAHINFQDNTSAGYPGYLADIGLVYGDRGNGYTYGWNIDNTANARNRNMAAADERYDTLTHMQKTGGATVWEIAVPNGTYSVHIASGDSTAIDSVFRINAEGVLALSGTPTNATHWFEGTVQVVVTDGRLTISNGAGSSNNKIDYIDIASVNTNDTTPPTVTAKSPAAGATVITSAVNIDVTFSEPVAGVDVTDLVLSGAGAAGASKGAPTNIGGNTWRFPVTGLVTGAVNVSFAPDAHDIEDVAGNDLAPVSWSFSVNISAPLFSAHVNFQDTTSAGFPGYVADTGLVFGNRGNGFSYGWNIDNSVNARNRNVAAPDERYDTLAHMQKEGGATTWEIAVPNGTYSVHIVSGDNTAIDSVFRINAEGVLAVSGTPTNNVRWIEGTVQVTVSDGRLTISNAAGSSNNKIDYIDITQLS